jgi:hypothetical protein
MTRTRLAALTAIAFVLPASVLAQTPAGKAGSEYYVIVDTRTKKCTVVDKTPQVDSPAITLATDAIYATRTEAEAAVKSMKPCKS